jgi:hypothetical protein
MIFKVERPKIAGVSGTGDKLLKFVIFVWCTPWSDISLPLSEVSQIKLKVSEYDKPMNGLSDAGESCERSSDMTRQSAPSVKVRAFQGCVEYTVSLSSSFMIDLMPLIIQEKIAASVP